MVSYGMRDGKISTCLYISKEVLGTAKRLGLNLSRVSENALTEAIGRLKGPEIGNGPENVVRGVGFGPTNPCGIAASERDAANRSLYDGEVDCKKFRAWIYKKYKPFRARDRYFHAKKYARCLASDDLSELVMLNDCQRVHEELKLRADMRPRRLGGRGHQENHGGNAAGCLWVVFSEVLA
jgi:hypothetical protein